MENANTIHIAYTVDVQGRGAVQFMDQLVAGVYALKVSKRDEDALAVHIVYANIPAQLMQRLYEMQTEDFTVDFFCIKEQDRAFLQQCSKVPANSDFRSWNGIVYARLFLAKFFPAIDRAIYLDADTLVRKSLHELWETDLGGKTLGMNMGTVPEYGYNSGVILMDLKKMREDKEMWPRLAEHMKMYAKTYYCPDQTVINRFFGDEITPIDRRFNFPPNPGVREKGLEDAVIWHWYNTPAKPHRIAKDDIGVSFLVWERVLDAAEKSVAKEVR